MTESCPRMKQNDLKPATLVKLLDNTRTVHEVASTDMEEHGEKDPSRAAKKSRELKAALASRKVTKTLDDANLNLCEARFYTFPMNLKVS